MKFNKKNIKIRNKQLTNLLFLLPFAVCLMQIVSCNNDKKENTVEVPKAEVKAEENHEEETPTIAMLTDEQIKTVGIQYGIVEQKELTATIKTNGNLKVPNNNKANATSLFGGVVKNLNVQVGSYVRKGQTIASIANADVLRMQEEYLTLKASGNNSNDISTSSNTQYASLRLEKEAIIPQIDYAKKEVARQKELYEGNAGARKNLESAQSNLISLQKKLEVLNAQLNIYSKASNISNASRINSLQQQFQMMGINPNNISPKNMVSVFYVTSPISGTVSNVFSKIGSYVDVSSPVVEIVDNGSLHLDLNVFEKDLPMLKVGQTIHFTLTNNPTNEYDAQVYSIGTAFENESKTIPVHCNVKGNKTGLIDGMNITALVSLNNVTTPAVPNDAIVEAEGKTYIFIVTDKKPEEHHEEGEAKNEKHTEEKGTVNFEKIEVIKGTSNIGYTAITFVKEIPEAAKIVTKGAFFINAKLTNTESDH